MVIVFAYAVRFRVVVAEAIEFQIPEWTVLSNQH
jgi:hypothetical protein